MSTIYGYVYLITNTVNNKLYVGQTTATVELRWSQHCSKARKGDNSMRLCKAIRKYGKTAFVVAELTQASSQAELDSLEQSFIAEYHSTERQTGYNVRAGGNSGGKLSGSTKQKLRDINLGKTSPMKGKHVSATALFNIRHRYTNKPNPQIGHITSEQTRRKIGDANRLKMLGRKASAETKAKMSATRMARYAAMTPEQRKAEKNKGATCQ